MMQADQRLKALFDQDLPPLRDVVFQEKVLQTLARRLLWQDLFTLAAACCSAVLLLRLVLPDLEPVIIGLGRQLTPGLSILVLSLLILGQGVFGSRARRL